MAKIKILIGVLILVLFTPASLASAAALEVGGWIPYWQDTMGTESAFRQMDKLDTVYPFAFEVSSVGIPVDKADLTERKWQDLFKEARQNDVEIIPTILWNNGAEIHRVLSNPIWRAVHIEIIARMVEAGDFDGINIDYESKLAETKDHYSTFLKELKERLNGRSLTCTVEARMPPESRWREIPAVIEYANDYRAIGQHCDVVEIMAYDQQRADLLLNDARKGEPYIPVADTEWVEKVVKLALKDIPASKIMLGVPTYGRQWTLTVEPDWFKEYQSVGAINLPDAEELAEDYDAPIGRNSAGEASYTFFHQDSIFSILNVLPTPDGTKPGFEAAAKALLFANIAKMPVQVNIVWYSDAVAIAEKVDLAEKLGLKGIAIFKVDGEEDQDIWDLF